MSAGLSNMIFLTDFDSMSRDDDETWKLVYLWDYLKGKGRIASYHSPL